MIIDLLKYFVRFILIILFQLLVVNHLELNTYVNAYFYILFILILPVSMKPWIVVLLSFFTGMVMDTFSSTPGLHMAATVFMGYLRGFYLKLAATKEDFESKTEPTFSDKGIVWFLVYSTSMVLAHHFLLFFLEVYGLREFGRTLLRIIGSSALTLVLILISQLLFYRPGKK